MGRGFAPVAIALSFVAGIGDRQETSALIASEPVQPLQRFLYRNLHQHGGRHLSAQCSRLTGPERCEITTALLLCRNAQRPQLTQGYWEIRNSVGQETDLASQPIDEGTRRAPGEHV